MMEVCGTSNNWRDGMERSFEAIYWQLYFIPYNLLCLFLLKISDTNADKFALYHLVPQQDFLCWSKDVKDKDKPREMLCFL